MEKVEVLVTQSCLTLCDPMDYVAQQAPLSMAFSRQEYWSGQPFPSPGDLPNPEIEPRSLALQVDSLLSKPSRKTFIEKDIFKLYFSLAYVPIWQFRRKIRWQILQYFLCCDLVPQAIDPLECKRHSNTFCEFFLARIIGSAFLCKVQ